MKRFFRILLVLIGLLTFIVVASLFIRVGEHEEALATNDLLAIPVPAWCLQEIEQFSNEVLQDVQSRLVHVENGGTRYPFVGAVLLIRPYGEKPDVPLLAFEALQRHCGIEEEFTFAGADGWRAMWGFLADEPSSMRRFILEVDGPRNSVRVVPLPSADAE